MDRSMVCRHENSFVDKNIALATKALFCPSLTGALFWRHKHCFVDRSYCMSTEA